jgi:hypothetical protein
MIEERPSGALLWGALLTAAAVAPLPFALMQTFSDPESILGALFLAVLFGFPIALVHAGLLGVPAYLLMRRRWPLKWWNAVPAGAMIGGLPAYLLWQDGKAALLFAACGAVGGLTFWFMARTPRQQNGAA